MKHLEPVLFDAPAKTLFIIEAGELRIITFEGGETLLLLGDFVALLLHVSTHRVAGLARFQAQNLRQLAAALQHGIQSHG